MAHQRARYDWNLFSPILATIINVHSCADNLLSLDAFIVPEEDEITSNKEENVIVDPVVKEKIGRQLKAHFNG